MNTRLLRFALALSVLVATTFALVTTANAATGTVTRTYGPWTVPAGSGDPHSHDHSVGMLANQLVLNVARPFTGDGTITGLKANLVFADGTTANWDKEIMLHHMVLVATGSGRSDATCPTGWGGETAPQAPGSFQRIFASGNERVPMDFSGTNYGIKLAAADQLHLLTDLMNIKTASQVVSIQVEYKYATGSDSTARKALTPAWFDADGCGDSQFDAPFGLSDTARNLTAPFSGALIAAAGHLHDHSLNNQLENVTRNQDMCVSIPGFGETPGYIDTSQPTGRKRISSMTTCQNSGAPAGFMTQGDQLRIHGRYYAGPEHGHATHGAMAIQIAYFDRTIAPPSASGLPGLSISAPAQNSLGTNPNPAVVFSASNATSVTCKLNRLAAVPCSSGTSIATLNGTATLADGAYTVQVAATNASGTRSKSTSFAIDTTAPVIRIPDPTEGQTVPADYELHLEVSDANVYTAWCSFDGAPETVCTPEDGHTHVELTGLAAGTHTYAVRATDQLGYSSTLIRTFVVAGGPPADTQAPTVAISAPANGSTVTSSTVAANFTASDNVAVTGTTCKLDTGAAAACTSPKSYTGLTNGSHTITVSATDATGNTGSASTAFTVNVPPADTIAPVVTITSPSAGQSINGSSVSVVFTATDNVGVTGRTCQLAGPTSSAQSNCTSPRTYSGLARGSYTVTVRATDAAGNVGVSTRSFRRR